MLLTVPFLFARDRRKGDREPSPVSRTLLLTLKKYVFFDIIYIGMGFFDSYKFLT